MRRDVRIDTMRAIAIMLIVLAHVSPPKSILVPRMFDVPMMTFLMGIGMIISTNKTEKYIDYIFKRAHRLILPAFKFLIIFFIFFNIVNLISNFQYSFTLKYYFGTFSTFSGLGYVWIIRVFFIISIISPVLLKINKIVNKLSEKLLLVSFFFLIQEIASIVVNGKTDILSILISNLLVMSFGYSIVSLVGIWTFEQNKKENLCMLIYFLLLFFLCLSKYSFFNLPELKYPPFPVYLLYGIVVSIGFWLVLSFDVVANKLSQFNFISWVSKYSMEIYYWHIIPVFYLENYTSKNFMNKNWIVCYILIICFAMCGTGISLLIKRKLFSNKRAKN